MKKTAGVNKVKGDTLYQILRKSEIHVNFTIDKTRSL